MLALSRMQGSMTSSRAWDSPASFLGSLEQEGEVTKGWRCSLGTLIQSLLLPTQQVLLALPAPGVPEPLPCGGCRHAWIWLL